MIVGHDVTAAVVDNSRPRPVEVVISTTKGRTLLTTAAKSAWTDETTSVGERPELLALLANLFDEWPPQAPRLKPATSRTREPTSGTRVRFIVGV